MEFSRQEYWSRLPFPPPGDLSDAGIKSASLCLLHWQKDSLSVHLLGSPTEAWEGQINFSLCLTELLCLCNFSVAFYMTSEKS